MRTVLSKVGDLVWRSDTRHSEAVLSWVMLGISFGYLLQYAEARLAIYLACAIIMLGVSLLGFTATVNGSYLVRLQCAMLRTFCWASVGIYALITKSVEVHEALLLGFLALVEATVYIKLFLLMSKRRGNCENA